MLAALCTGTLGENDLEEVDIKSSYPASGGYLSFLFTFFDRACGMRKFLSQGSNLSHSSNSGHCRDNAGSLTCCAIRERLSYLSVRDLVFDLIMMCLKHCNIYSNDRNIKDSNNGANSYS